MIIDHATCDKMEDVEKLNGRVFTDQILCLNVQVSVRYGGCLYNDCVFSHPVLFMLPFISKNSL